MKKSEIFGKNRTKEISVHFPFRGSPKNDISAKYRPKKPKFLSMPSCYQFFRLISEVSAAQCEPVKKAISVMMCRMLLR